jgi:hypothetical protein
MNKYLLMSAVAATAVTAGSGVAQAATTVHLNSYCDYFVMYDVGQGLWAAKHIGALSCNSNTYDAAVGIGMKGKVPGAAKIKRGLVALAEGCSNESCDNSFEASEWVFSTPLGPKGSWALIVTFTGSTAFVANSGLQGAKATPGVHKTAVADAIKTLRSK